jgi:DNA gyrase subunit A
MLFPARTLDTVLFFSDKGKVYAEKAYQIPDTDRSGRGIPIVNVLSLGGGETITAAVAVPQFDPETYVVMATLKGKIKRMALSEIASVRPSGLAAINLESGDQLGWVRVTDGRNEIILVTEGGRRCASRRDRAVDGAYSDQGGHPPGERRPGGVWVIGRKAPGAGHNRGHAARVPDDYVKAVLPVG